MSQCSVILGELRRRRSLGPLYGLSAGDCYVLCRTLAAHSRISELRGRGHKISSDKFNGIDRYYLEFDSELDSPKSKYSPELKAAGF